MIVQQSAAKPVASHFSSFTLFCCDLFDFFLCFQHGSVFSSLQSEYIVSVCLQKKRQLVFLVLYIFCIFCPLKDRYAFSMSPASGASTPDPHRGSPLDPGVDLPSPDPVLSPLAHFWLRPCAALFKSTMPTCSRNSKLAVHVAQQAYLPNIFGLYSYFPASSSLIR